MNILVTGGAGFIGSHLCQQLIRQEHRVIVVDNLHPYYPIEMKKKQLEMIRNVGDFTFHNLDLLEEENVESLFHSEKFDKVIHLAALPGVAYSVEQPDEYVDYDIKATVNVLKYAGKSGVEHVIFSSSSSVYGNQNQIPVTEDMATGVVTSPYAAAKYGAESFCHAFQSLYQFKLTILRFFTVYGPMSRPDMAISIFLDHALNNQPIEVFGRDTARDYTHIEDIVEGIILAFNQKTDNEIYNLGSGQPKTMNELLGYFMEEFPGLKVIKKDHRPGDVKWTWANYEKANREISFSPKVSFEEGIRKTIAKAKQTYKERG
ncbi:NAD-dependent epimerase/dehydratase family protein [Bacillaceae bacterium S4-13-56]